MNNSLEVLESRIRYISDRFNVVYGLSTHYDHFIDVKDYDLECQEIGLEILKTHNKDNLENLPTFDENIAVFIISVLLNHGGGVRMLEDYVKIYQNLGMKCKIIVTEIRKSHPDTIKFFQNLNTEVIIFSDENDYTTRIVKLQNLLMQFRPHTVFLFHFHSDFAAICGVQKQLVNKLYLPLILDHSISIGIHIPYIDKIIINRKYLMMYFKNYIKIPEEKLCYIPLSKNDMIGNKIALDRKYCVNGYITTGSCTSCITKITNTFKYKFIDVIVEVLKITKGKHIHIGAITDDQIVFIKQQLISSNIDPESFVHIKNTSCLAKCFLENNIDILIQTFPIGGGLVSVEAMQSGLKIINYLHEYSYIYNMKDWLYPEAFFWQKPKELYEHLKDLRAENIAKEGQISRKFYDEQLTNQERLYTKNNIKGMAVDYEAVEKIFNYKINIFDYLFSIASNKINKSEVDFYKRNTLKKIINRIRINISRKIRNKPLMHIVKK